LAIEQSAASVYWLGVSKSRSSGKVALAAEVWQRLFDFIIDTRPQRDKALGRHDLTPNDSRALFTLDATTGRTMGALAEAWECDASNATWIVDRLEKRGLAERRAQPGDRRVKLVVLTTAGVKMKSTLREALYQPPRELLELDRADLEALSRATVKLRRGKP
jgi:DNA-binding MarR family transcriptional regulator